MASRRNFKGDYWPVNIIDGNVEYDQVRHLNINLSHMISISTLEGVRFDVVC